MRWSIVRQAFCVIRWRGGPIEHIWNRIEATADGRIIEHVTIATEELPS